MWIDDIFVILLVVIASSAYLVFQLFLKNQSTFNFWEKLSIQKKLNEEAQRSIHTIDHNQLMQQLEQRYAAGTNNQTNLSSTDQTTFVLSEYSLPVCRSLWRIVEYVLSDFIDFWWVKISDSPEFDNDLRDVFDHAFNVLGERSIKIDWSPFIVKNVISNLNYLMRIYRLTEQELSSHNPFFSNTPEAARQKLIKAELMRTYKLHVAVSNPQAYLRKLSTAVLSQLLRSTDFRSETVRTMTREVMTTFIFLPVMNFVDPYWVNVGLVTFLKAQQEAKVENAAAEAEPVKRSAKTPHHTTTFSQVSYSSLQSPNTSRGNSRSNSPSSRGLFSMPATNTSLLSPSDEDAFASGFDSPPAARAGRQINTSAAAVTSTDPFMPPNWTPTRKESLLTQKMKEWEGEKAKRKEKNTQRKGGAKNGNSSRHTTLPVQGSADFHRDSTTIDPSRPVHDEDIPTGLLSPSGAFSHSPNHATSPMNANHAPHPSQLTANWEVRIIGAGIRFDPKPFVMYQLLVKNGDSLKWTVVKRYNKFEELHQKLKKAIPSFDAQLPTKRFFGNLDQQFIQNRKIELQTYLGQLLWNKNVQMNADLQEFLLPSADDAKWTQTPGGGMSGSSTPSTAGVPSSSSFSFFGPNKQRTQAATVVADDSRTPPTGGQPAPSPQHVYSQSLAPGAHNPLPMQQQSLPAHMNSALNGTDEDVFAPEAGSVPPRDSILVDSPRRVKALDTLSIPSNGSTSSTHPSSSASPPGSPGGHVKTKPPLTRTYSADDITPTHSGSHRTHSGTSALSKEKDGYKPSTSIFSTNWEDKQLTDPLLAIVEEIFNLNGRGWMRRQATWVGKQLVKMTMDGLIKNKLNKSVDAMLNETMLTAQIDWVTELIWPNGKLFESKPPVTEQEKERCKEEALNLLKSSIPTALRTLLGGEHCVAAMEKCFQFMQTEPLIQHFAYSVLDSLVLELFPELTHTLGR